VAALSASSNLTCLSLGCSEYRLLLPAAYDTWFPAGSRCPYLEHVDLGVQVLGNTAAVQRMARACPGLKELELADPFFEEPEEPEDADLTHMGLDSAIVAASLQALTNLTSLACLRVEGYLQLNGACISPAVIDAWSHWTSLQELELFLMYSELEDLLVLTQLRSLRLLNIDASDGCQTDKLTIQVGMPCKVGKLAFAKG